MIRVSTHLFGSTDGYKTLARSADIGEPEERALAIFGFGAPKSKEEIERLLRTPSAAARLLPSGRFALTRLFPGEPDVAGRDTVERRSLVFSAQEWRRAVRCDLDALLMDERAFDRAAFLAATDHAVELPESGDLLPQADDAARRLYDILLSTPHHGACALLPDDPAMRRALFLLLRLLPLSEASRLSWGVGLFAATPGVRIATAATAVPAGPTVIRPSLSAPLQHRELVDTLGMDPQARVAVLQSMERREKSDMSRLLTRKWTWLAGAIALSLISLLVIAIMAVASRKTPRPSPPPVASSPSTVAASAPGAAQSATTLSAASSAEPSATAAPPSAPLPGAAASNEPGRDAAPSSEPGRDADRSMPASSDAPQPAHDAPPAAPATMPASPAPDAALPAPEPANAAKVELELWSKSRAAMLSAQQVAPPAPTDAPAQFARWLRSAQEKSGDLDQLQQSINAQADKIGLARRNWIDPKRRSMPLIDDSRDGRGDADQVCRAAILAMAEFDLLAARLALQKQVSSAQTPEMKKKLSSDQNTAITALDATLQRVKWSKPMREWIEPGARDLPPETLRASFEPPFRAFMAQPPRDALAPLLPPSR